MPNDAYASLTGHLGRNADAKQVGERWVISFSVAVSRKRKDVESTTWWNVNYWSKSDGLAQYLLKGTAVSVRGQPHMRKYKKKDGTDGESLDIDADNVQLLGAREKQEPSATTAQPAQAPRKPADPGPAASSDEPPFLMVDSRF